MAGRPFGPIRAQAHRIENPAGEKLIELRWIKTIPEQSAIERPRIERPKGLTTASGGAHRGPPQGYRPRSRAHGCVERTGIHGAATQRPARFAELCYAVDANTRRAQPIPKSAGDQDF